MFLQSILTVYLWTCGIFVVAYIVLYVLTGFVLDPRSRLCFNLKMFFLYYIFTVAAVLLLPVIIIRPRNIENMRLTCWLFEKLPSTLGVTWEVRGNKEIMELKQGVVIANHQSELDLWVTITMRNIINRSSLIVKKSILFLPFFGQFCWWFGIEFVERKNTKQAFSLFDRCRRQMTEGLLKIWVYPEGTRNYGGEMHSFKKGAFHIAILNEAPIFPVVVSPYYFMDYKKGHFGQGHVIIYVLDPIPTTGLKTEDADQLATRCREIMAKKLEEIGREVRVLHAEKKDLARPRKLVKLA